MRKLILGLLLAAGIGCTSITPVGPLAKMGGPKSSRENKEKEGPPEPITVPAVKPTPPLNLVDPSDVQSNPDAARQNLMSELEGDTKTIAPAPKTAEVSVYKGGVKQK